MVRARQFPRSRARHFPFRGWGDECGLFRRIFRVRRVERSGRLPVSHPAALRRSRGSGILVRARASGRATSVAACSKPPQAAPPQPGSNSRAGYMAIATRRPERGGAAAPRYAARVNPDRARRLLFHRAILDRTRLARANQNCNYSANYIVNCCVKQPFRNKYSEVAVFVEV